MKRSRYKFFFLIVLIFLSACGGKSQGANSIDNSPCDVPCWQKITPGVTKAENISALLKSNPYIDENKVERLSKWNKYDESYKFVFKDKKAEGEIYVINNLVDSIWIIGDLDITVEHLLKLYGEPEKIIVSSTMLSGLFGGDVIVLEIYLVYLEKGVAFSFYNSNLDLITIKPIALINNAIFSEPKNIINIVSPNKRTLDELERLGRAFDWRGYQEIRFDPSE